MPATDRGHDPQVCPLCGEPNDCGVARGCESVDDCWCKGRQFPEALLERAGLEALTPSCVCATCLEREREIRSPSLD